MITKTQAGVYAAEINDCLEKCRELRYQHTKTSIVKTVEFLNRIHDNMQKMACLENSSMQYSVKIKIENREYSYLDWMNEIVLPNYSSILSYLELDCNIYGVSLYFDEQTIRVSLQ